MNTKKIGFIGFGKMATAIYTGLIKKNNKIEIMFNKRSKIAEIKKKYNIKYLKLEELINESDIIIIATKPNQILAIIKEMKKYNLNDKLIISLLAGTPIAIYEKHFPKTAIIRMMPNIATLFNESITGICWNKNTKKSHQTIGQKIASSIGETITTKEEDFHLITALCGSSPAFFYHICIEIINLCKKNNLSTNTSRKCIAQLLIGSGKILKESKVPINTLIKTITSPNGTTQAGLEELKKAKAGKLFSNAIDKAIMRSKEIEKNILENNKNKK